MGPLGGNGSISRSSSRLSMNTGPYEIRAVCSTVAGIRSNSGRNGVRDTADEFGSRVDSGDDTMN